MMDVLDDLFPVSDLEDGVDSFEQLDAVDEDLDELEGYVYEDLDDRCDCDDCRDDDDEEYYDVECPNCGEIITVDRDILRRAASTAPSAMSFELRDRVRRRLRLRLLRRRRGLSHQLNPQLPDHNDRGVFLLELDLAEKKSYLCYGETGNRRIAGESNLGSRFCPLHQFIVSVVGITSAASKKSRIKNHHRRGELRSPVKNRRGFSYPRLPLCQMEVARL